MTEPRLLAQASDDELGAALRELGLALAVPGRATTLAAADSPAGVSSTAADGAAPDPAGSDPARRARQRIEAARGRRPATSPVRPVSWLGGRSSRELRRPARRGLVLGLAAVLAVAAVAGAIGFGVPGIRIVFGPAGSPPSSASPAPVGSPGPTPSPLATRSQGGSSASVSAPPSGPLGTGLGLGTPIAIGDAADAAGIPLRLPPDPPFGDPVSAWDLDGRVSLLWPAAPDLPPLREQGIGLILGQFRGSIDPGYFGKVVGSGTVIDAANVGGATGWWITGEPHELVFVNPSGEPVFDSHRIVGDTLIWAVGDVTYRLESALGRDATIRLAESLR